jgi:hypothetical protein
MSFGLNIPAILDEPRQSPRGGRQGLFYYNLGHFYYNFGHVTANRFPLEDSGFQKSKPHMCEVLKGFTPSTTLAWNHSVGYEPFVIPAIVG